MQDPGLSPAEVKQQLKASAIDMGEDERQYYGAGMLNFPNLIEGKEFETPQPDVKGGFYNDTQTVTFTDIPAGTQLVYTLDKSVPSSTNGTVYTEPITIDNEMQLTFALIKDGKYASNISSQYYTIQYYMDESYFTINDSGVITSYTGDKNNIIVPDTINGIVPLTLNADDMEGSKLTAVVLPDSVVRIIYTFSDCTELKYVTAKGVTRIDGTFKNCYSLRNVTMPDLNFINANGFSMCSMIHDIDFEDSLESALARSFEYTGLLEVNFPNLKNKLNTSSRLFANSSLLKCDIPIIERVDHTFQECYFLQELNAPNLKRIKPFTFADCWFLTEMEFPNLEVVESSAFAYCYIDTIYAPKLTSFSKDGTYGIAYQAFTRVMDFPEITEIPNDFIVSCYLEELYMENLLESTSSSCHNLPYLNVIYMPNVLEFNRIGYDSHYPLIGVGPREIVWIPSATEVDSGLHYADTMKLFYAPSLTKISADNYNATFVLSEKAQDVSIRFTREAYLDGVAPTIIAPYGSAAQQAAISEECNFIDSDSMGESLGGQIRTRDSGLRFGFIFDEKMLGFDISEYENLYPKISKEYGFVYTYDEVSESEQEANTQVRNGADGTYTIEAAKRNVEDSVSHYNAVFTGIPASHYDSRISARAYICIDGMYFYSPVTTRSFNDVANAIVNDDTMDPNTRSEVYNLINREV